MLHTTIVLITKNQSTFYHGFLIIHYINNSNFKLNLVQHTKTKMLKLQIKKNLNNLKKLLIFFKTHIWQLEDHFIRTRKLQSSLVHLIQLTFKKFNYLEEADSHVDEAVRTDSSSEHFIQISLQEELFQHQNQVLQVGKLFHVFLKIIQESVQRFQSFHTVMFFIFYF